MPFDRYYWHAQPAITDSLISNFRDHIGTGKLVVDVGAGYAPWEHATELIDREAWPQIAASGKRVRVIDIENEPLPYADKSVDFIYCRHTIEDLHNPTLLLREMNRVAKAGYIETPSPLAEFTRGVDANGDEFRGYSHHRWFCWSLGSQFCILPKLPIVETVRLIAGKEEQFKSLLQQHPLLWNSYFAWCDRFTVRELRHPSDFTIRETYGDTIIEAMRAHTASVDQFVVRFPGIAHAEFVFFDPATMQLIGTRPLD
jgi:SAM-dependent methyltransferase